MSIEIKKQRLASIRDKIDTTHKRIEYKCWDVYGIMGLIGVAAALHSEMRVVITTLAVEP